MKRTIILLALLKLITVEIIAQKNSRTFIFGHSLIHHEFQVNPTPSQETSVPHWLHFLAEEANHEFAVSGQYGFLPQHANLPPIAQWGFDFVEGIWDSDNVPFSEANFNNILITPGNFIQWQGPNENYPMDNISPLSATNTIFDWCTNQEDSLVFYIYENWPDMASYLNSGFPPSASEWDNYNEYLNDDFHNWFLEYHDALIQNFPNSCIRMIPVGPSISKLLQQSPFDQIPIEDLYEDDAPHGRASIYFLASLTTYMAIYEEKAPSSYQVDPIVHPIIADNYQTAVDFIWNEINNFENANGENRVFCSPPVTVSAEHLFTKDEIKVVPNPVNDLLTIEGVFEDHSVEVFNVNGAKYASAINVAQEKNTIDLKSLPNGIYILIGRKDNEILYRKRIVKMNN